MNFDKKPVPEPPAHLRADSQKWFQEVVGTFQLEEHHVKLLIGACEALDVAEAAREAIAADGAYIRNRFNEVRKHPALGVQRDAMTTSDSSGHEMSERAGS